MSYGVFGLTSFTIGVLVVIAATAGALSIALRVKDFSTSATVASLVTFVLTVVLITTMCTTSGIWVAGGVFTFIGALVTLIIGAAPLFVALVDD